MALTPPANYTPHTRVVFGGTITDQGQAPLEKEQWSCSVNLRSLGNLTAVYLSEIAIPLGDWFQNSTHTMAKNADLTYVKANNIKANGGYDDPTKTNVYDYATPAMGLVNPIWPEILCVATTWLTARQRGTAAKGRVYLPNWTQGTPTSMQLTSGPQLTYVNTGLALLEVLKNAAGSVIGQPVVASGRDGAIEDITRVAVGNIVDVQRRRKNAWRETYVSAPVPT